MVMTRKSIPRRAFLRGTGAALALPMLDAMTPAFAVEAKRPTRMSFIEVPNGIMNLNGEWTPKTVGTDFELTQTLQPLASFRDRMLVLTGLDQQQSAGLAFEVGGDHPRACTAWLTGSRQDRPVSGGGARCRAPHPIGGAAGRSRPAAGIGPRGHPGSLLGLL